MKARATFAFAAAPQQDHHDGVRRARGLDVLPLRAGGKQAEMVPFQEGIHMLVWETRRGNAPEIHPIKG